MSDDRDDLDRRRAELEARLEALRPRQVEPQERSPATGQGSAIALAMRVTTEFLAGLAVGAALGYGADRLLGTSPFGFILLFLLGFAASVYNVFRATGLIKPQQRQDR